MDNGSASFKLQDRTAILVGPCTTFNQAIALKLTSLGANVALIDRNIDKAQRFASTLMDAREVHERYGRAAAIQADLSKAHHVQDAITRAAEAFGGLDIYIDGLMSTDPKSFRDPSALEDIERLIDVNVQAPLLVTHSVLRFLEGRKRGRIIYLMHDLVRLGLAGNGVQAATRTGLIHFAKTLAQEISDSAITVNCVSMGATEEFLISQSKEPLSSQSALTKTREVFPRAQLTDPEKIANLVAFLASPLGAGISGQLISVNQGLS